MKIILYLLTIFFISLIFLFSPSPRSRSDFCGEYIRINDYAGFTKNCDTRLIIGPAKKLGDLFQPRCERQSRPLYIILGAFVTFTLKLIMNIIGLTVDSDWLIYSAFVLINFILLFASTLLYDSILTVYSVKKWLIYSTSIFLICNDVTKAFIWTPHFQIFAIFVPLCMVYLILQCVTDNCIFSNNRIYYISFITGIMLLMYGNFILIFPCLLYCLLFKKKLPWSENFYYSMKQLIFVFFLFFIPTLVWIATVTYIAGYYHNVEVACYRQFIWIFDKMQLGPYEFARHVKHYSLNYFKTFNADIYPFLILSIIFFLYSYFQKQNRSFFVWTRKHLLVDRRFVPFSIPTVIIFIFYWLLGFYGERLTFTIVPPLLCFIVVTLSGYHTKNRLLQKLMSPIVILCSLFWVLYHVLKYGPFS